MNGLIEYPIVKGPPGKSDNNVISFYISLKIDVVQSESRVFNLNKRNYEGVRSMLV